MRDSELRRALVKAGIVIEVFNGLGAPKCVELSEFADEKNRIGDRLKELERNQKLIMDFLQIKVDEEPRLVRNQIHAIEDDKA